MSLFDFMFPEQAQASHLRDIADASRDMKLSMNLRENAESTNSAKLGVLKRRIKKLESDMALMSMINTLLIKKYIADTKCSLTQLQADIAEVDKSDGVEDGGFDTQEMRKILGLAEPQSNTAQNDSTAGMSIKSCQDCGRNVITQHGFCLYCGGAVG